MLSTAFGRPSAQSSQFQDSYAFLNNFYHFDERVRDPDFTVSSFEEIWQEIPHHYLKAANLVAIPKFMGEHLAVEDLLNLADRRRFIQVMVKNLPCWEDRALVTTLDGTMGVLDLISARKSFARMGIMLSPEFKKIWEEKVVSAMGRCELDADTLGSVLCCYAGDAEIPSPHVGVAFKKNTRFLVNTGEFLRLPHIVNAMRSCAILNACGEKTFTPHIAHTLFAGFPVERLKNPFLLTKLQQSCLWFDMPFNNDAALDELSISRMERELRSVFHEAGYPYMERAIKGFDHRVDLTFRGAQNKNTMVEIDGPQHFVFARDPQTGECIMAGLNGATVFQSALITKMAVNAVLLRLPFRLVDTILHHTTQVKQNFVEFVMESGRVFSPGSYFVNNARDRGYVVEPLVPAAA